MLSTMTKERMEQLRYDACESLYTKFHIASAATRGRDYFTYRNNDGGSVESLRSALKVLNVERRQLGIMIASATKEAGRDEMNLLAMTWQMQRKMNFRFEWFRKYALRRFGEDVVNNLKWKNHWVEPVWQDEEWFQNSKWAMVHKVHQSEDNQDMIAYNRTIDNVGRDIQTRTKPGKYLTQFFSDVLTQDEIREWAEKQVAFAACNGELKYIENDNEEGWVDIYQRGPNSCMQGEECVGVYAYPGNGIRLAYIETGHDVHARAIVRNKDDGTPQGYIRIYATEQRWSTKMAELLDAAGYGTMTNLHGVKLQRIETDHEGRDGVVCPYIDSGSGGTQSVTIYHDHLRIESNGEIRATNTCGSIPTQEGEECDDCGSFEHEDDMNYIEHCDRRVCNDCCNNNYTYAYGRRDYQDYYQNEDCIYCESNGEWYLSEYASNHDVYQCRSTEDWYHIDDLVTVDKGNYEGDLVHVDQVERDEVTDLYWCSDDMTWVDGKYVPDEFVGTCHITGNSFDTRFGVAIEIGQKRSYYGTPYMHTIYVSPDAWNLDMIRQNFVRSGDMLLPRGYYGNEINNVEEPSNVEYGDEFDGEKFEDIFVEEVEELLAA